MREFKFRVWGKILTGLKDKNGKPICKGDIMNYKAMVDNNMAKMEYQPKNAQVVVFKKGAFRFDGNSELVCENLDYEIIGNIYENKNLLGD